jgi:hypothetical protein
MSRTEHETTRRMFLQTCGVLWASLSNGTVAARPMDEMPTSGAHGRVTYGSVTYGSGPYGRGPYSSLSAEHLPDPEK